MVRFSSFVIIHESRIIRVYFDSQTPGEFSMSRDLAVLESRIYFETQMAGEFSMSQILLKLGVKWPLVKACQLHYVPA